MSFYRQLCCCLLTAWASTVASAGPVICDEDMDGVDDTEDVCCGTPIGIPVDATGRPIGDLDGDCDTDLNDYALFQSSMTGPLPPCPPPCTDNVECVAGEFCSFQDGACGGDGECVPQPAVCPQNFNPVCGCDGVTYSNACEAAMAGVSVSTNGPCVTQCTSNGMCNATEYCAKGFADCDGQGLCEPIPPGQCPAVFVPVCGCDGNTYAGTCVAAQNRVNVASIGECPAAPCNNNQQCAVGQYCETPVGGCGGAGQCVAQPDICIQIYDPVCGCDGLTYSNSCIAAAAGVGVASEGECLDTCRVDTECDQIDYCRKDNCPDVDGVCAVKPQACPQVFDPVCGCDGQTYGNSCLAAMAGVNVAAPGPCVSSCNTNQDCALIGNSYCAHAVGDCNGGGECQPIPPACPLLYDPVCGCDGITYGNACLAAKAGVSIQHDGVCALVCVNNAQCAPGQYCMTADGDCGGQGICVAQPDICVQLFDPVCGCDGQTYGNACFAGVSGVNVDHQGECCP